MQSDDLLRQSSAISIGGTSQDVLALLQRANSEAAQHASAATGAAARGPSTTAAAPAAIPSRKPRALGPRDVVAPPARFAMFGRDLTNGEGGSRAGNGSGEQQHRAGGGGIKGGGTSFLGRSGNSNAGAAHRSTSNMGHGGRSFVFGVGEGSNSMMQGGEQSRDGQDAAAAAGE